MTRPVPGDRPVFPPRVVVGVKALACELPKERGIPRSRYSTRDLARIVVEQGITASISGTTVWRWLSRGAIRPWNFRRWILPRDPDVAAEAGRVLDLYHQEWDGLPLGPNYVLSADEKPSIQARARPHATLPAAPGAPMRVEHEDGRAGALVHLAAWDVHRAKLSVGVNRGAALPPSTRSSLRSRISHASARRMFWVVDNGSSHRGARAVARLAKRWPNLVLVHLPVHASWLNQIEIIFSILQRKVLTPNAFDSLFEPEGSILAFAERYQAVAKPFDWKYTRQDLLACWPGLHRNRAPFSDVTRFRMCEDIRRTTPSLAKAQKRTEAP